MNSKYLAISLMLFGLLFTLVQCEQLTLNDRYADDSDTVENGDDSSDDVDDASLREEKRAIREFLQNEDDASQFLDQSRRFLTSDTKSHMKEAKKKYEEKCERLLHPRYCPDLATWPAWNQAWNAATGKK
ncbi:unnamed protein product [Rotaria sp. Silwood1]|nr:unnamed protein product [Rotaria sp. Silwood1]CAF1142284.1 unnamed protein product [Rotaria sp. Silwood1]CAF3428679.1 unnamed protein product [Rotaria sp. Silwood1]CAF3467078.1 unnamed protein product [Rotaria sp. Silwood1]CAF4571801.1 unnamed protein product [Rotaria sp. Silwood1]